MSKLYRSLLWSGLVVAGVAACGDDVTVAPPPNQGVQSVTVGPTGVTIAVGQTLQMAAAVNADAGVATTVTWTSSNPATASVNPTSGLVTGAASGSVAITACSTVATGVCGQATVTVSASTPVTISIKSITQGGTNQPVNISAIANQIDVVLNLDAGTQQVSSVDVLIDGTVACSQGFGAIQAATARAQAALLAGDDPTAALAVEIVCSINTAAFNALTGIATWFNGPRLISAQVNLVGSAPKATPSTSVVFANTDTFVLTQAYTGTTATASSPAGLAYNRGGLTFSVLPVIYRPGITVVAGGTLSFGSFCDASGIGTRTVSLVAPAAGSSAWTATLVATSGTASSSNVRQYEFDASACPATAAAGEVARITASGSDGNTIFSLTPPAVATGIRLDNRAPDTGYLTLTEQVNVINGSATPVCCTNNWIGKAYNPATGHTNASGSAGLAAGAVSPSDEGVGIGTVTYHAGDPALDDDEIVLLPAFTSGAGLTETASNTALTIVANVPDLLGNADVIRVDASAGNGANPLETIGVDLGDPTLNVDAASIQHGDILAALPATFVFNGTDGLAGFSPLPIVRRVSTNFFDAGQSAGCYLGSFSSSAGCRSRVDNFAFTITGGSAEAYYSADAVTLRDQGGNSDPVAETVTVLYDITNPVASSVVMVPQPNGTNGGAAAQVSLSGTDNVDGESVQFWMQFLGGLPGTTTIPVFGALPNMLPLGTDTFGEFGLPLDRTFTSLLPTTVVSSMQATDGAGTPAGALFQPQEIWGVVSDVAGLLGANFSSNLFIGWVISGNGLIDRGVTTWTAAAPAGWVAGDPLNNGGTGGVACAAGTPSSLNLSFAATGSTAFAGPANPNFQSSPFTRVDVFFINSAGELTRRGAAAGPAVSAPGVGLRAFTWSFNFSAAGIPSGGPFTVVAVGFAANGDALVSMSGFAPFTTCGS